ncbi:adenylate/guanylate cyclase domain-containing protein [Novosphingobium sp. PC22D]|uniref:adenylate/guanylate cyclase domain-containing protein n=1 Tax=Novosphingobium sp. PC22D TaxID=1962403 RepID=UPI000BEFFD54|nr:adenylate/guanylate cyclase domain-containing protein [Novosphingobium sp. PC22D]PEQ10672.1 adenylate/guanylate cyclase domain-containing protein [Novosphingobium sp. PC22D]
MAPAEGSTRGGSLDLLRKGWRSVRAASALRMASTGVVLLLALLIARYSWYLPAFSDAERSLYDVRAFQTAEHVPQDERVLIVAYTEQTLIKAEKRSPLDRGMLARALRQLDTMGAKAIGIDILFDQPQAEDAELIAALRAMKTPVSIGYTTFEGNAQNIVYEQQAYLDAFLDALKGTRAGPASIRLNYEDGVARRWPERLPGFPLLLGKAMLEKAGDPAWKPFDRYSGAIRYRLPATEAPIYSALEIDLFADPALLEIPELSQQIAQQVRGRYVLIGGEIVDTDRVETAFTPFLPDCQMQEAADGTESCVRPIEDLSPAPPGIRVHATMISQMLDGATLPHLAPWQLWLAAILWVVAAGLTSLIETRISRMMPFLVLQLGLIAGIPFSMQAQGFDTLGLPAVGWIIAWALGLFAVSSLVRASSAVERQFAQTALGKYLPEDIAQEIIDHPDRLALSGAKRELFILFSDLEGFTELSHQLAPEQVAKLLNDYLDRLSAVVLEHGGIIDKYVGDAVVAFWGAPISRPDDGRKAALAGYAMWQAGEDFRKSMAPGMPRVGKTRVGMHFGEAVVGNFGGERRIQYTALGDAMNTAARLESANKALDSAVMASREFAERSGLDWWRPMGRVTLRGRASPVELFEPAPQFPEEDRAELTRAMAVLSSDPEESIAIVRKLTDKHPADRALLCLLKRLSECERDNAYVLG